MYITTVFTVACLLNVLEMMSYNIILFETTCIFQFRIIKYDH